jgi:membrane-associated HD superfamily phosphohydrolase
MADERKQQLMQEALDGNLTPEIQQALFDDLEHDAEAAQQWNSLQQVDMVLRTAPFERAPARMALKIMARLVEEVKTQQELQTNLSSLALTLSLALVTVVMMPVLMAASWLVLNAMADAEVLTRAIEETIALLAILIETVQTLLTEAQNLAETDPDAAVMVAALVPLTLLGFVRYMEEFFTDDDSDAA